MRAVVLIAVLGVLGAEPNPPTPFPKKEGGARQKTGGDGAPTARHTPPSFLGKGVGGLGSPPLAPAPRPAPLRATALDGSALVWPSEKPQKALCLVFVGTDCPLANGYAPEIARIVKHYESKGVTFAVVYPLPDAKPDAVRTHAKEYAFPCPAVLDANLKLATRVGATTTPEAVVLSPTGDVLYRGRIDDRYPKAGGKRRENPTTFDLRDALDAALTGKPAAKPWPPAVGCPIDF